MATKKIAETPPEESETTRGENIEDDGGTTEIDGAYVSPGIAAAIEGQSVVFPIPQDEQGGN